MAQYELYCHDMLLISKASFLVVISSLLAKDSCISCGTFDTKMTSTSEETVFFIMFPCCAFLSDRISFFIDILSIAFREFCRSITGKIELDREIPARIITSLGILCPVIADKIVMNSDAEQSCVYVTP